MSIADTMTTALKRPLKDLHKMFILWVSLKFKLSFQTMDRHLYLSSDRVEAVDTLPNLPASLIRSSLGRKGKGQSVEVGHASRLKNSFPINLDPITSQYLDTVRMRKWNQPCSCGGRRPVKNLLRSHTRHVWSNPRPKNKILLLLDQMDSSTTNKLLADVSRVHTIYTLWLPH